MSTETETHSNEDLNPRDRESNWETAKLAMKDRKRKEISEQKKKNRPKETNQNKCKKNDSD